MSNLDAASYEGQCRAAANYVGRIDKERPAGLAPERIAIHFGRPLDEVIEHIESIGRSKEPVA